MGLGFWYTQVPLLPPSTLHSTPPLHHHTSPHHVLSRHCRTQFCRSGSGPPALLDRAATYLDWPAPEAILYIERMRFGPLKTSKSKRLSLQPGSGWGLPPFPWENPTTRNGTPWLFCHWAAWAAAGEATTKLLVGPIPPPPEQLSRLPRRSAALARGEHTSCQGYVRAAIVCLVRVYHLCWTCLMALLQHKEYAPTTHIGGILDWALRAQS